MRTTMGTMTSQEIRPVSEEKMEKYLDFADETPASSVPVGKTDLVAFIVEIRRLRKLNDDLIMGQVRAQLLGPGFTETRLR